MHKQIFVNLPITVMAKFNSPFGALGASFGPKGVDSREWHATEGVTAMFKLQPVKPSKFDIAAPQRDLDGA